MSWKQQLKSWLVPQPSPANVGGGPRSEPGMYHFQLPRDGQYMRFHLRVEPNGEALLIAGASEAIRLSPAGAAVVKRLLEGMPADAVKGLLPATTATQLVAEATELISELGSPSARFPIFNLWDPLDDARDADLIATFQADVEVATLTELRTILEKLWEAGIPHARFLPAAELNDDRLWQAIEWAEDLGMIAGVRATAGWLAAQEHVQRLAAVGTDYVLLTWALAADLQQHWFGADDLQHLEPVIHQVREFEMTPVLELPLVPTALEALESALTELTGWQIEHGEVYAVVTPTVDGAGEQHAPQAAIDAPFTGRQLPAVATLVEEAAEEHDLQLTWLPPVAVEPTEPIAARVRRGPRAGGDVTVRILPNGDVLPPRGGSQPAGNLLSNSWNEIWECDVFSRYRARVEANTRCQECPGLAICAADCPADPAGWSHDPPPQETPT